MRTTAAMVELRLRRWFLSVTILPTLSLPLALPLVDPAALAILTIWQEARGEAYEGKLAVAEVIRDRTLRGYQSDGTLVSTLFKPFQFSGWNTQDAQRIKAFKAASAGSPLLAECARAWMEAVTLNTQTAKGALLYHADPMPEGLKKPGWAYKLPKLVQIGAHAFYTDPAANPLKGEK